MRLCPGHGANQEWLVPLLQYLNGAEVKTSHLSTEAKLLIFIQNYNKRITRQKDTLCTDCAKTTRAQPILNIYPGSVVNRLQCAAKKEAYFVMKNMW